MVIMAKPLRRLLLRVERVGRRRAVEEEGRIRLRAPFVLFQGSDRSLITLLAPPADERRPQALAAPPRRALLSLAQALVFHGHLKSSVR